MHVSGKAAMLQRFYVSGQGLPSGPQKRDGRAVGLSRQPEVRKRPGRQAISELTLPKNVEESCEATLRVLQVFRGQRRCQRRMSRCIEIQE